MPITICTNFAPLALGLEVQCLIEHQGLGEYGVHRGAKSRILIIDNRESILKLMTDGTSVENSIFLSYFRGIVDIFPPMISNKISVLKSKKKKKNI